MDKMIYPNVSIIQRFHCTLLSKSFPKLLPSVMSSSTQAVKDFKELFPFCILSKLKELSHGFRIRAPLYVNTSSYYSYCSLCALFRVLVSIRKVLGLDSTDGAVFCVSRVVVSEREQETCCSPEPVHTRTTRAIAP